MVHSIPLHPFGHSLPTERLRLIRHAQITPIAASIKDHRFAGADSQVGSRARSDRFSVAMRSAVTRQMKKPMPKRTAREMRAEIDIWRCEIAGMGRRKMARSVARLEMAFVQLEWGNKVSNGRGTG